MKTIINYILGWIYVPFVIVFVIVLAIFGQLSHSFTYKGKKLFL